MSKGTENFKNAINSYLENYAKEDSLFAISLKKENKNIDDCVTYILNEVKNSGLNGFEDSEIYGMALHYYDEDKIEVGNSLNGKIVVNHFVELSEEEKAEVKQKAIADFEQARETAKLKERNKFLQKTEVNKGISTNQASLF